MALTGGAVTAKSALKDGDDLIFSVGRKVDEVGSTFNVGLEPR